MTNKSIYVDVTISLLRSRLCVNSSYFNIKLNEWSLRPAHSSGLLEPANQFLTLQSRKVEQCAFKFNALFVISHSLKCPQTVLIKFTEHREGTDCR